MDVEKLIRRLRNDADAYRNGETLGRAFADQEDVLDNAATALSTLQTENEKLRAELDEKEKHYDQMIDALSATNSAELEQVKAERDAAIEYLREIEWCAGCKHFGGLDGCKKWVMGQCMEKHDLYEFIGPQKED